MQNWFVKNCDGDWEHAFGVKIETLDNPGWSVSIDLEDTSLENETLESRFIERSEENWVFYKVEENLYKGACGPHNLNELLENFLNWAKAKY